MDPFDPYSPFKFFIILVYIYIYILCLYAYINSYDFSVLLSLFVIPPEIPVLCFHQHSQAHDFYYHWKVAVADPHLQV